MTIKQIAKQISLFSLFYVSSLIICSENGHTTYPIKCETPFFVNEEKPAIKNLKRPLDSSSERFSDKRLKVNDVNMIQLKQEYESVYKEWESINPDEKTKNIWKKSWDKFLLTNEGKAYTRAQNIFRCDEFLVPGNKDMQPKSKETKELEAIALNKTKNNLMQTNEYRQFIKIDNGIAYLFYKQRGLRAIFRSTKQNTFSQKEMVNSLESALLVIDPEELSENRKKKRQHVENELLDFIEEITQFSQHMPSNEIDQDTAFEEYHYPTLLDHHENFSNHYFF